MIHIENFLVKDPSYLIEKQNFNTNFWKWFGNSKVVDANHNPLKVYHGTQRPDRVGTHFDAKRATSGPMAYFTDSPDIASSYAKNKHDSSIEDENYNTWFKIRVRDTLVPIDQTWHLLSPQQRQIITQKLPHIVNTDENGNESDTFRLDPNEWGHTSEAHWNYVIKEKRGDILMAALDLWVESGNLFNEEERFLTVLKLGGLDTEVKFDSPFASYPAVYPVYLSIQNPLDTSKIPDEIVAQLKQAALNKKATNKRNVYDQWDKSNVSGAQWVARFNNDLATGTTHVWTSIPDWVTRVLKSNGYDGIKDTGGKYSDTSHTVWIPFNGTQIKSIHNKGSWNKHSKEIQENKIS